VRLRHAALVCASWPDTASRFRRHTH
jgi:hypothetical protein